MAGPRIFVPGPGVNPGLIGSPAQYMRNIANIADSRRRDRQAANQLAQQKAYQDASLALSERRQDFIEAEPERKEAERLANLAREAEKAQMITNMAEGLQYAGGDRFTTLDDDLMKDPRYAALDDAGKLAARNRYIQANPTALTDPGRFGSDLKRQLLGTGLFTGAEADAAVAAEVSSRYPTANPDIIKSMLAKPDFKIGTSTRTGTGSTRRGSSPKLIADPTDPKARGAVVDRIAETYELDATPDTVPFFGNRIDVGNLNPAKTDISQAVGFLSLGGVNSPTAQEAAFAVAFNPDRTIKPEFDWRTPEGRQALTQAGLQAQRTEERLIGGGDASLSVGAASPADVVNAANQYNAGLLSSLTPRALSDAEVVSSFLDSLGGAPAAPADRPLLTQPRQGGNTGGSAEATASPVAPVTTAEPEFQVGGPVQAEVAANRIFNVLREGAEDMQALTPPGLAKTAITEGVPAVQNLIESLTPPDPGVLDSRTGDQGLSLFGMPIITPDQPAPVDDGPIVNRAVQLNQARALERQGVIKPKTGGGRTKEEALLEAYFEYLEGQRN